MKKMIIAGNWKMNTNGFEAEKLAEYVMGGLTQKKPKKSKIILCPPFTSLHHVSEAIKNSKIGLGAQDCHYETKGAFTGEISAQMLVHVGCNYVIIGHSERRTLFFETDELINKKLRAVVDAGMIPIFCIGETLQERQSNQTYPVLERQLIEGLRRINFSHPDSLIVAYEPVWAIGTGISATPAQIDEAHNWLRKYIIKLLGNDFSDTAILYGGSMNGKNAESILSIENVNGGLIGGASLDPQEFLRIIEISEHINI